MQVKKILLKYQKPQYKNDDQNVWVAHDSQSGGYPYATNIMRAYDFGTVGKARAYLDHFDGLDIVEVTFTITENVVEKWEDKRRYQVHKNTCRCHPETCGCNPWVVKDKQAGKDNKLATFYDKVMADKFAKALNEQNEDF